MIGEIGFVLSLTSLIFFNIEIKALREYGLYLNRRIQSHQARILVLEMDLTQRLRGRVVVENL